MEVGSRTLALALVLAATASLAACEPGEPETVHIAATLDDTTTYQLALPSATIETARVVQQASHAVLSEVRIDPRTQWSVQYAYTPAPGFVGTDSVQLEVLRGQANGTGPMRRAAIYIRFTVAD